MQYCRKCGMPLEDSDRFCVRCGAPLGAVSGTHSQSDPGQMKAGPGMYYGNEPGYMGSGRKTGSPGETHPGGEGKPSGGKTAQRGIVILLVVVCLAFAMGIVFFLLGSGEKSSYAEGEEMTVQTEAAAEDADTPENAEEEEAGKEAERQAEEAAREAEEREAQEEARRREEAEREREQKEAEEKAAREAEEARKKAEQEKAEEEARKKAEEEEAARKAQAADGSYILADSSSRYYSYEELSQLDDATLQMAINELYARHGRLFDTPSVQKYFDGKSWYQGTISPENFDGNESRYFNSYETRNRETMAQIREDRAAAAGRSNSTRNQR